ncbi:hypothetical protein CMI37_14760 [Candidatus Pacearchaeota archaeon]|nr:hypothetical protein [Candidatus Pacearchaeota archaeon]
MYKIRKEGKLIAEFMEWEYDEDNDWYSTPHRVCLDKVDYLYRSDYDNEVPAELFEFITSWDWLMPVIRRIIDELNYELPEDSNLIGDIMYGLVDINMNETYKAVIKFIKWYNNDNKRK